MVETLITSSALITVLALLRLAMRGKIRPGLQYALWLLVLARLLIPVSWFESPVGVASAASGAVRQAERAASYTLGTADAPAQTVQTETEAAAPDTAETEAETGAAISLGQLAKRIWAAGSALMGLWFLAVNGRLLRGLRRSRKAYPAEGRPPVYVAAGLPSPCLYGLFRPAVYLTELAASDPDRAGTVILHERIHFRHLDHIWTLLRAALLIAYWFDPFVWLAAALSRRDCELCCDAATVKALGESRRYEYGRTLLDMTAVDPGPSGLMSSATTMTGSRKAIAERIGRIAKKPRTSAVLGLLALCVAAAAVGSTFSGAADKTPEAAASAVYGDAGLTEENEFYDYLLDCLSAWQTGPEEWAEYIWFYNDFTEEMSLDAFSLLQYASVQSVEQVNDSLCSFLVELQPEGLDVEWNYYFVGRLDGRLYVFLSKYYIPDALAENLNLEVYPDMVEGEVIGTAADAYWGILSSALASFYDPASVQINVPADYTPASALTGLTLEELAASTDSFLFDYYEAVEIDESAAAIILTDGYGTLYFLPETDELLILSPWDVTTRIYSNSLTGWELVDAVLDWARDLVADGVPETAEAHIVISEFHVISEGDVFTPYSAQLSLTLQPGETVQLHAAVCPANVEIYDPIQWASSDESVATVTRDGLLAAGTAAGECQLTASAGGVAKVITVTVAAGDAPR